jgi:hypothetical protein
MTSEASHKASKESKAGTEVSRAKASRLAGDREVTPAI